MSVIKVGIMSMQRIANYGSFLQAYGLKKIFEELGCDVQFVDYHPGETLIASTDGKGIFRVVSKVMETMRYQAPLKEKKKYIIYKKNYSTNYYPYLGIDSKMNFTPELDLLVIGSDEVFNCVQNNTNVGFTPELFGEGNHAEKLISYAASFGNTTEQKLIQYHVTDKLKGWLEKFDDISVRDENSGEIVRHLVQRVPQYHLDPVLAYDFIGKGEAESIENEKKDYMIVYGYSGRFNQGECKGIREYADLKGLCVYCIGGVQGVCDKFIDCSPFQVITYFENAKCVVTDTFHGTILSIITHQRFVSLVRENGYGNAEKLVDLLKRMKLENRMMNDIQDLSKMMSTEIDYTIVDDIIKTERSRTYDYLKKHVIE